MANPMSSVIIPAHNEAQYIGKCLQAIGIAARAVAPDAVETIVVANRCTDKTQEIAENLGARVLVNDDKCIAAVRNTGVRAAFGEIIVTVDADSVMRKEGLTEIKEKLESGKYVGGGFQRQVRPDVPWDRLFLPVRGGQAAAGDAKKTAAPSAGPCSGAARRTLIPSAALTRASSAWRIWTLPSA